MGQGEVAGNGDQRARGLVRAGQWDRAEERLGIGVAHLVEDFDHIAGFHRFAGIHHTEPVADIHDEAKVVADEQHRGAVFLAQILDEIDDPRLNRHIQCRGGFIKDQQGGL